MGLLRALRSLVSPVRIDSARVAHDGVVVVVAGEVARAAVFVKARGFGVIGAGADSVVVDGSYEGVVFGVVAPAAVGAEVVVTKKLRLPVKLVAAPPSPKMPALALPNCDVRLPAFSVSLEIPSP